MISKSSRDRIPSTFDNLPVDVVGIVVVDVVGVVDVVVGVVGGGGVVVK